MGRTLNVKDFDLERIFGKRRSDPASFRFDRLSPETGIFCLELAKAAKKYGTRISFDLNYRASFWKDREDELRRIFTEIASITDIMKETKKISSYVWV